MFQQIIYSGGNILRAKLFKIQVCES